MVQRYQERGFDKLTRDELEYRRYLERRIRRRKRKRQVMIARTILVIVILLAAFGIFSIVKGVMSSGDSDKKQVKDTKKPVVETMIPTKTPESTAESVPENVPKGYEDVYNKLIKIQGKYNGVDDIIMNISKYPKKLLELAVKNPETIDFVSNYPKHDNDTEATGRLSAKEIGNGIPSLQQWDSRWGYIKYGDTIIGVNGCGPTCLAMVYAGITKDTAMTPADIAQYCSNNNYYNSDTGTSWTLMTEGAKDLELSVRKVSVNASAIKNELKQKRPMICSMSPGDFTTEGHFIVIRGIDSKGRLIINDPNSIANSKRRWQVARVVKQIKAAWSYSQD